MANEQAGNPPATTIRIGVTVSVTVTLIPEHYFIEPGFGRDPDIQVQRLTGYVSADGHMNLQGSGKQIKANGEPGSATRNVYVVSGTPDHLRAQILADVKASVAAEAEKYAAL